MASWEAGSQGRPWGHLGWSAVRGADQTLASLHQLPRTSAFVGNRGWDMGSVVRICYPSPGSSIWCREGCGGRTAMIGNTNYFKILDFSIRILIWGSRKSLKSCPNRKYISNMSCSRITKPVFLPCPVVESQNLCIAKNCGGHLVSLSQRAETTSMVFLFDYFQWHLNHKQPKAASSCFLWDPIESWFYYTFVNLSLPFIYLNTHIFISTSLVFLFEYMFPEGRIPWSLLLYF